MIVLQPNTGKIPESHFDIYNFDGTNSDFEYLLNLGPKHTLHDGEIIMSPPLQKNKKYSHFPYACVCLNRLPKAAAIQQVLKNCEFSEEVGYDIHSPHRRFVRRVHLLDQSDIVLYRIITYRSNNISWLYH